MPEAHSGRSERLSRRPGRDAISQAIDSIAGVSTLLTPLRRGSPPGLPHFNRLIFAAVAIAALAGGCAKRETAAPAAGSPPAVIRENAGIAQPVNERSLRARLRANPHDPAAYEALAKWLMGRRGHGVETMNLARRAVALDEGNASLWLLFARACDRAGRFPKAIEAATRSLELEPGSADAHALRGWSRGRTGDLDGALEDHRAAAALEPGDPEHGRMVGRTLHEKGDLDGAVAVFNELLVSHPNYAAGYVARGFALARSKKFEEARSDLELAVGIEPENARFRNTLGDVLMDMEKFAEAEIVYTKAIGLRPAEAVYFRDRGRARISLRNLEGAMADLDKAVALDPRNGFAYSVRGRVRRDVGDFDGAISDFGMAIRMAPGSKFLWRQRANTRFAAGEFRDALTDLEMALKLGGDDEPYEQFWAFLFRGRVGEPAALDAIEAIARTNTDPWIQSLARFFNGEIDEAELFAIADAGEGRKQAEQQCEAWCYAAIVRVNRGEAGARELFEKCVALEIVDFYEHTFAIGELSRMNRP